MPTRLLVLLACLLANADAQSSKSAKSRGKLAGKTPSTTVVGKLRLAMLTWYCAETSGHVDDRPCQNFHFMQKLRKAEDPETRKRLVQERSATMPKDDAGRKKLAMQSREGYLKMYKAYCAQPSPANPAVCTNESLKKVYENMEKSIKQSTNAA
eukprot:CAMPEP_0119057860 /NCGR_PEP_ID=MMETSP1178-20130426/2249_1 /TAXON_ID=33656 /ORGANISM="unid sp, Strain CCMP2000" /LENGTH=153 /DNA_ID=CAMNT_0007038727 /DNA_START=52 /DNA_END=513 /DNA_ORIENTATION=-